MTALENGSVCVEFSRQTGIMTVEHKPAGEIWRWDGVPSIAFTDGARLDFPLPQNVKSGTDGVSDFFTMLYTSFGDRALTVTATVRLMRTDGSLRLSARVDDDENGEIAGLYYPAAFLHEAPAGEGASVLPFMQGALIPSGWQDDIDGIDTQFIFERAAYMPFYGQIRRRSGYIAIFDTPYDVKYHVRHTAGADTSVMPYFITSLGKMRYERTVIFKFIDNCDHVKIAKAYRKYADEQGRIVTLAEKAAKNPAVKKLFGTPIVHEGIAVHISEKSDYYDKNDPDKNDNAITFAARAKQLRQLREAGAMRAYLHLDGWGKHGYDNLHPDPFPPNDAAGGVEGMRMLSETCRELGYTFGIHDQYRDYYYDAPSFDMKNAIENIDGSHPYCSVWYGGPHSWLCQSLAPDYVRRNYDEFERLGIKIEGAYLDVFSVVYLDECFSKEHPMTRRQCAEYRLECFNILAARGIIPSSEEAVECMLPVIALCHHAPYYTKPLGSSSADSLGIPIPLLNLVYHDCIVIPWSADFKRRGGWGIPKNDLGFDHALLNGGTVYLPINSTADDVKKYSEVLELHARVACLEMTNHEFLDSYRRQRTTFADGTTVEVDFDANTHSIGSAE